jgi:hypothetical protein
MMDAGWWLALTIVWLVGFWVSLWCDASPSQRKDINFCFAFAPVILIAGLPLALVAVGAHFFHKWRGK